MASAILRGCSCLIVALFLAPHSRADEAEAVKQLKKIGAYVITIGSESAVAFEKTNAIDGDMQLLLELKNLTSLRFSDTKITDAGFRHVGRLKNLKELLVFASKNDRRWRQGTARIGEPGAVDT
jgi:hypothetical protein